MKHLEERQVTPRRRWPSSWERGANENTNGLVRQYIPKGSDFTNITQEFLKEVEK